LNQKLEDGKIKPGNQSEKKKKRNGIEWSNFEINEKYEMR
jgi:hypothetical protein